MVCQVSWLGQRLVTWNLISSFIPYMNYVPNRFFFSWCLVLIGLVHDECTIHQSYRSSGVSPPSSAPAVTTSRRPRSSLPTLSPLASISTGHVLWGVSKPWLNSDTLISSCSHTNPTCVVFVIMSDGIKWEFWKCQVRGREGGSEWALIVVCVKLVYELCWRRREVQYCMYTCDVWACAYVCVGVMHAFVFRVFESEREREWCIFELCVSVLLFVNVCYSLCVTEKEKVISGVSVRVCVCVLWWSGYCECAVLSEWQCDYIAFLSWMRLCQRKKELRCLIFMCACCEVLYALDWVSDWEYCC